MPRVLIRDDRAQVGKSNLLELGVDAVAPRADIRDRLSQQGLGGLELAALHSLAAEKGGRGGRAQASP